MKIGVSRLYLFMLARRLRLATYPDYRRSTACQTQLHPLSGAEWADLARLSLKAVMVAHFDSDDPSDNPSSSDLLIAIVATADAVHQGYTVFCWCGPNDQFLAVGYRPEELEVYDDGAELEYLFGKTPSSFYIAPRGSGPDAG